MLSCKKGLSKWCGSFSVNKNRLSYFMSLARLWQRNGYIYSYWCIFQRYVHSVIILEDFTPFSGFSCHYTL